MGKETSETKGGEEGASVWFPVLEGVSEGPL